jgi:hypothetical protein
MPLPTDTDVLMVQTQRCKAKCATGTTLHRARYYLSSYLVKYWSHLKLFAVKVLDLNTVYTLAHKNICPITSFQEIHAVLFDIHEKFVYIKPKIKFSS